MLFIKKAKIRLSSDFAKSGTRGQWEIQGTKEKYCDSSIRVNLNSISCLKATKKIFLDSKDSAHHVVLVREWSCFYVDFCLKLLKSSKAMKINLNYNKLRNTHIIKPCIISFRNSNSLSLNEIGCQELMRISPETTQMAYFFNHKWEDPTGP